MEAAQNAADAELPVEHLGNVFLDSFCGLRTITLKKEGHDGEVRSAGHITKLIPSMMPSAWHISLKAHPKGSQDVHSMFTACAELVDAFWFWGCVKHISIATRCGRDGPALWQLARMPYPNVAQQKLRDDVGSHM